MGPRAPQTQFTDYDGHPSGRLDGPASTIVKDPSSGRMFIKRSPQGTLVGWDELTSQTIVNVQAFGADVQAEDNGPAIQRAVTFVENSGGGEVFFPDGNYRTTTPFRITSSNVMLRGHGSCQTWGQAVNQSPVTIDYRGSVACMIISPASNGYVQAFRMDGIRISGINAGGNANGIYFDNSASNAVTAYSVFTNCCIENFPYHQVYQPAAASGAACFGLTFRNCNINNRDRGGQGEDLVRIEGDANKVSQITFDDCWLWSYASGKWCFHGEGASIRFLGGTVTIVNSGNGVWSHAHLSIVDTHFEGNNASDTTNIGIRYTGAYGAKIMPASCSTFGIGLEIGDPANPGNGSRSCLVGGSICANNPVSQSVSTLTRSGRYATCTTPVAHGYVDNERVTISGATPSGFNGTWRIKVLSATQFSFMLTADPGSNASGTIVVSHAKDIVIVAGGDRTGTVILPCGDAATVGFNVIDNRSFTDGVKEVVRLDRAGEIIIGGTSLKGSAHGLGIETDDPQNSFQVSGKDGNLEGSLALSNENGLIRQQLLNYDEDNQAHSFDAYLDSGGLWRSSDAGSNFQIYKVSDGLIIRYKSGVAVGGAITWSNALRIDTAGGVYITSDTWYANNRLFGHVSVPPEGAVIAPVGSQVNTDAHIYLKTSGSGSSGWTQLA